MLVEMPGEDYFQENWAPEHVRDLAKYLVRLEDLKIYHHASANKLREGLAKFQEGDQINFDELAAE